jgi:hypothetical protein
MLLQRGAALGGGVVAAGALTAGYTVGAGLICGSQGGWGGEEEGDGEGRQAREDRSSGGVGRRNTQWSDGLRTDGVSKGGAAEPDFSIVCSHGHV